MLLPPDFFSGREITDDEYDQIRSHAKEGFEYLKDRFLVTALICGLHHSVGAGGYGLSQVDIPRKIGPGTAAKILRLAIIVSACDFADVFTTRQTVRKDGDEAGLRDALLSKYPHSPEVVRTVLDVCLSLSRPNSKEEERSFFYSEIES